MEFEPRLPQHSRNVQVVGALRARHRRMIGRANIANQIQFSRIAEHSDHWRAQYWALALPQSWPTTNGDCRISIRRISPTLSYELILKDAVIRGVQGSAKARSSYHTVTIDGGELQVVTAPS